MFILVDTGRSRLILLYFSPLIVWPRRLPVAMARHAVFLCNERFARHLMLTFISRSVGLDICASPRDKLAYPLWSKAVLPVLRRSACHQEEFPCALVPGPQRSVRIVSLWSAPAGRQIPGGRIERPSESAVLVPELQVLAAIAGCALTPSTIFDLGLGGICSPIPGIFWAYPPYVIVIRTYVIVIRT